MIRGVSHEVRQWITDGLDHGLIQFGFLAGQNQMNLLAGFAGEIADQARESAKGIPDRNHTNAHHTFLNLACYARAAPRVPAGRAAGSFESGTQITEHGLRNDEFAHQIDQPINLDGVYTDRRVSAFFAGGVPSD